MRKNFKNILFSIHHIIIYIFKLYLNNFLYKINEFLWQDVFLYPGKDENENDDNIDYDNDFEGKNIFK